MPSAQVASPHIVFDERGVPWIDDSNVKVVEVVLDATAHGLSPEEIHFEHHRLLSLAQIHAALSYYYDNQTELDAEIQSQERFVDALRTRVGDPPLVSRLRASGHLS